MLGESYVSFLLSEVQMAAKFILKQVTPGGETVAISADPSLTKEEYEAGEKRFDHCLNSHHRHEL